jgi:hypothetical protein
MSFRKNNAQQMSIFDSTYGLTERERKALDRSWAKIFAEDVFPQIDEERFSVLYSDKASRPNTPVNVIVGALVIKELFGISDDEIVDNLMLDPRYQMALHTSSYQEQPLSDKSLSRFRVRCYNYEQTHGVDLYHGCVTGLAEASARMMGIDKRIRRMDSLMVEANIRKLSRMELIYTCISKLVSYLHKNSRDDLIGHMAHYYDPNDFNKVIYHCSDVDVQERFDVLFSDADLLLERCNGSFEDVTEYQLFLRCISEQTIVEDGKRRLRTKEDGGMTSGILQNPSDPDATYREKAGKRHRGYAGNIEESVGKTGSIVTDYQFNTNNKSDSEFLKEHIDRIGYQEEKTVMITDGAYSGDGNVSAAAENNIDLITTDLTGADVDPIMGAFQFSDDGTKVTGCPAGHAPRSCWYNKKTGQILLSFEREKCAGCPYQMHCHPKIFKRVSKLSVSLKMKKRALTQNRMETAEFKQYARLRNGVETVPSLLKNRYGVNRMPVHGLIRCKFYFGCKVAALNFRKLFRFRKGSGHYALNPALG